MVQISAYRRDISADEFSKGKSDSFFFVRSVLKDTVAYQTYLRLFAAYEITKHLVNDTGLVSGSYKISFVPEDGGKYKPVNKAFRGSDTVALKIVCEQNGLRLGSLRHKHPISRIYKSGLDFGADTLEPAELKYASVSGLLGKLSGMAVMQGISQEDAKLLEHLVQMTAERLEDRQQLIAESCGNDSGKIKEVLAILESMSRKAAEIGEKRKSGRKAPENLPDSLEVKAAALWPISSTEAANIAALMRDSPPLQECIAEYASELKRTVGVDVLELTSKDMLLDLTYASERVALESKKSESLEWKLQKIRDHIRDIIYEIDKIDRAVDSLNSKSYYSPHDLARLCDIGELRCLILEKYGALYAEVGELHHAPCNVAQLKMHILNMASNGCEAGAEEPALWNRLLSMKNFTEACGKYLLKCESELAAYKKRKHTDPLEQGKLEKKAELAGKIAERIKAFASMAAEEDCLFEGYRLTAAAGTEKEKDEIADLEREIIGMLVKLASLSPSISSILTGAYFDSKSHVAYKKDMPLSHDMHYYLPSAELLFEIASSGNGAKHAGQLQKYLEENAALYKMLEEHGMKEEIMEHLGHFLYSRQKGFDLESDAISEQKEGYRGKTITVKYRVGVSKSGDKRELNLKIGDITLHPELPSPMVYEEGFLPDERVSETLYGKKNSFHQTIEKYNKDGSLSELYTSVTNMAGAKGESFAKVSSSLRSKDLATPYFPYTFYEKEDLAGLVTNFIGNNPPGLLHMESDLDKQLRDYCEKNGFNFEEIGFEVEKYKDQKIALLLFKEMNRTLPYWLTKLAEKIEKKKSS